MKIDTIVLTRPKDRQLELEDKLTGLEYKVISIPCLDVKSFSQKDCFSYNKDLFNNSVISAKASKDSEFLIDKECFATSYNIFIFVSVNAVTSFFKLFDKNILENNQIKLMAIGAKTANILSRYGFNNIIYPQSEYEQTSEHFVNLQILQNIQNTNIALIRGDKSREYISTVLKQRNCNLSEIVIYQTKEPVNLKRDLNEKLGDVDNFSAPSYESRFISGAHNDYAKTLIIITSVSILDNLMNNLDDKFLSNILKTNILVASDRIAKIAKQYRFENIFVSNTMNQDTIIGIINSMSIKS